LGDGYIVALNLLPATPRWLQALGAKPMYLGLDLRGGVYFLMQVDMGAVIKKAEENLLDDVRRVLRDEKVRYLTTTRMEGGGVLVRLRDATDADKARELLRKQLPDVELKDEPKAGEHAVVARLGDTAIKEKKKFALEQNITSLNNRVNELGVAEPVIQQQGEDRIVVQLPGVQDTAQAKKILGRTATLEVMLVDEEHDVAGALAGQVPLGSKIYKMRDGRPILLKHRLIYSGDNIVDAAPGFHSQDNTPIVSITLDARGAVINQRVTGENINKRMAIIYIEIKSDPKLDEAGRPVLDEKGNPVRVTRRIEEVITAPVIRSQLGKRFQIEGLDSVKEANELALLLRAGAFAAPVVIVEERTVGPSLGADNVAQGVRATLYGLIAVLIFMVIYYKLFGVIANLALFLNLFLLVAVLSLFQATLTLPGIAGILLTLGMAVDANVLINERIREEVRNGNSPQASINAGYEKAWHTIVDANITTLIAAVLLFNLGTGPIKGFAITLTIGILTTMFTAVLAARAITNLSLGNRKITRVPV
jgi:preprotein translocase subunit SecD